MPLYNPANPIDPIPVVPTPDITAPASSTPVYASNNVPAPTAITDIEGEPWTVTYWGQLLNSNESPKVLDLGLDPSLQQYVHITAFRISVTGDLTSSIESVTNTTVISGEGLIYPDTIVPNVGDMFIGRIEAGTQALFTLTTVERLSFYARSVYRVEYRIYADIVQEISDDLHSKIADQKYFDNKRLVSGQPPIVSYDTVNREERYRQSIDHLMDRLYVAFFDHDIDTFVFTTDQGRCYDPWAVSFFNTVLGRYCRKNRDMPVEYTFGDNTKPMDRPTLWRMLQKSNIEGLSYLYPRSFPYRYTGSLSTHDIYHSISHVDVSVLPLPEAWNTSNVNDALPPYVFSHNLYKGITTGLSALESAFLTVISKGSVSNATLDTLLTETDGLVDGPLFYHILLLTAFLKIKLGES